MFESLQEYKRLLIIFGILFTLLLGGYGIFMAVTRAGKIEYTVNAVPSDATITLNGTKIQPGKYFLEPGYYTITAAKQGYTTHNEARYLTATLRPEINISLPPVSDEAKRWAKDNKTAYDDVAKLISTKTTVDKNRLAANNPITKKLPFQNYLYRIDYEPDPKDPKGEKIQLNIDAVTGQRTSALYIIRQLGYDPMDYRINFVDLTELF